MMGKRNIIVYMLLLMMNLESFAGSEIADEVYELIDIISRTRNIQSISFEFTKVVESEGGYTGEGYGKLAYCCGNIYYSITQPVVDRESHISSEQTKTDKPRNLLELFVKRQHERYEETPRRDKEGVKAVFKEKEGRYLQCSYNYYGEREEIISCSEDYPYRDHDEGFIYLWISRDSPLHTLGISFLYSTGMYLHGGGVYMGVHFIPLPEKPIYDSLIKMLQDGLQQNYPDLYKIYKRGEHTILLYDYVTAFWFDGDKNLVKITQENFFSNALKYEDELRERYAGDITNFLEHARYTYLYTDYKDFPDGVRVPLKIEFIREYGLPVPELQESANNYWEARKRYDTNSEEFKKIEKEYTINRALIGISKIKCVTAAYIVYTIYPETLVVNEKIPEEVFNITIEERTPIYKGNNVLDPPTYMTHEKEGKGYFKINYTFLAFIAIAIASVLILIFLTRKYFGWGGDGFTL